MFKETSLAAQRYRIKRKIDKHELATNLQKGFEIGATLVDKDKLKTVTDLAQAGSNILETISPFLGPIGVGLTAVTGVIQILFITGVLKKAETEELKAINKGFEKMDLKLGQISDQISRLDEKHAFYKSLTSYRKAMETANLLSSLYVKFCNVATKDGTDKTGSAISKEDFVNACRNTHTRPDAALETLWRIIVAPTYADLPHIAETSALFFELHYDSYMAFYEALIADAYKLAVLQSACAGAVYPDDEAQAEEIATEAGEKVREIVKKLGKHEQEITEFKPLYAKEHLKRELNAIFQEPTSVQSSVQIVDLYCKKSMDMDKTRFWKPTDEERKTRIETCKGDTKINPERVALIAHLKEKYPWLSVTVVVAQPEPLLTGDACTHDGQDERSPMLFFTKPTKSAFVFWSKPLKKESEEPIFEKAKNAKRVLDELKASEKKDFEQIKNEEDSSDYKSILDYQLRFLRGSTYLGKNHIFCKFEGKHGKYLRSIYTDNTAYYITQNVYKKWIRDTFVMFYV